MYNGLYKTTHTGNHLAYNTTRKYPKEHFGIVINLSLRPPALEHFHLAKWVVFIGLYWKGTLCLYHYFLQFTVTVNLVKLESFGRLIQIIRLDSRKSYLVIICPSSNEKLTKIAHRKSYLVIICPNSHEKLTKSEIR